MLPNIFIIGAPKCGTTALSCYLASHPNISMSVPKEPMYFLTDYPKLRLVQDERSYLKCFNPKKSADIRALGEASALYLVSEEAIKNIIAFNPDSKIIVMIRNPISMALSLHAQNVFYGDEDKENFADAWNSQISRRSGQCTPRTCRDPILLDYEKNCKLGSLLARLYLQVPEEQINVILLDDLLKSPGNTYAETLQFLNLPHDRKTLFAIINERKAPRNIFLNRMLSSPPRPIRFLVNIVKRSLNMRSLGLHKMIVKMNSRKLEVNGIDPEVHDMLQEVFSEDINILSDVIKRDLSCWKKPLN